MGIELRELSLDDGYDVYEMLQDMGTGENGYVNTGYGMDYAHFPEYLMDCVRKAGTEGLEPGRVPQTVYWLFVDGRPVGMGKLRHYLNDALRHIGGHIGYGIRPGDRGKGYAKAMLRELLVRARELGIREALLTCLEGNAASRRVIEANGGVLADITDGECHYRIRI